jgi:hypothetical protein
MKKNKRVLRMSPSQALQLQASIHWTRFDFERTIQNNGSCFVATLLENNIVSVSIPSSRPNQGALSQRDVVEEIAKKSIRPFPIASLSPLLQKRPLIRGVSVLGDAWRNIDQLAWSYDGVRWWFSKDGLVMDVVVPASVPRLPTFDEKAGGLMTTARLLRKGTRLQRQDYEKIAEQLSEFRLLDQLSGADHNKLATWNKENPRKAIHTFSQGLNAKLPKGIRRAILRRLYRAAEKVQNAKPEHTLSNSRYGQLYA